MDKSDLSLLLKIAQGTYEDFITLSDLGEKDVIYYLRHQRNCNIFKLKSRLLELKDELKMITVIHPAAAHYPAIFHHIPEPPLVLLARGPTEYLVGPNLSVIGSREPNFQFLEWMDIHLYDFLQQKPIAITSGGARGIDQKASEVALRAQRPTIIFLPSGLNSPYPQSLKRFANHSKVLWVSEYFMNEPMRKFHFYKRNRLIAGLGKHLFAIQMSIKSGSMITVRYALDLGKDIWTIPDFPGQRMASGNLLLLRDGARPIMDSRDLLHSWDY